MTMTKRPAMDTGNESSSAVLEHESVTRAAWEVIEDARRARVTGELTLTTASPAKTMIYLNSGTVYFAERETDESLATRLVLAGAINPDQLHRGALRLNGVEHLGRLFDRDATVERDEVELALEMMTEQTLTEIAEQDVLSSHITMYRHHVSGVVRWFSTPSAVHEGEPSHTTSTTDTAPTPVVTHALIASPVPPWEPPTTAAFPTPTNSVRESNIFDVDLELLDQPLPTLPAKPVRNRTPDSTSRAFLQALDTSSEKRAFVPISTPVVEPVVTPLAAPVAEPVVPAVAAAVAGAAEPVTTVGPTSGTTPSMFTPMSLTPLISSPIPVTHLVKNGCSSGSFPMTNSPLAVPAEVRHDATPVPEDVAAAVRRAITAIEAATQPHTGATPLTFGPMHVTSPGQSALGAMDTGEQPIQLDTAPIEPLVAIVAPQVLTAGQPSPVGPRPGAGNEVKAPLTEERKSALRRLINGVRRR